jgi:hypothetical protein
MMESWEGWVCLSWMGWEIADGSLVKASYLWCDEVGIQLLAVS